MITVPGGHIASKKQLTLVPVNVPCNGSSVPLSANVRDAVTVASLPPVALVGATGESGMLPLHAAVSTQTPKMTRRM
jgi:hypothetical protein